MTNNELPQCLNFRGHPDISGFCLTTVHLTYLLSLCIVCCVYISKDFKDFHFFKTNTLDRTEIAANLYVKVSLSKAQSK